MFRLEIAYLVFLGVCISFVASFNDPEMERLFRVKVLSEGDNTNFPKAGNKLKLNFRGFFLETKKEFDSSSKNGGPATIIIGRGMMIECWERLIPKISVNEKIAFVCPHSLAYGVKGMKGKIPPKTNLAYEVELLEIIEGNFDEL